MPAPTSARSRTSRAAGSWATCLACCPAGVRAELDWDAWERPPVFAWLAEQGVEEAELRRVFNCGIGMCAVVPSADAAGELAIGRIVAA